MNKKETRLEFEETLKNGNVTDTYLKMPKEKLEKMFGEKFMETVNFGDQKNKHHQYELWEHILRTVDSVDELNKENPELSENDLLKVKIAAFFHDCGKPDTKEPKKKDPNQWSYNGHAGKSFDIGSEILKEMGYDDIEVRQIVFLIENHDAFMEDKSCKKTIIEQISQKRKVISKNSKVIGDEYQPTISDYRHLLVLCKADAMAQAEEYRDAKIKRYEDIEAKLEDGLVHDYKKENEKNQKRISVLQNRPQKKIKDGKVVNQN